MTTHGYEATREAAMAAFAKAGAEVKPIHSAARILTTVVARCCR
jgi:hypothetical protein